MVRTRSPVRVRVSAPVKNESAICRFVFFASKKPPGYKAHPKVRCLWRRISLPGGFLIRTCGSLQAPFVAQCQGSLDVQGGENERSRNFLQKNLKSVFAGKNGKTSPLRRGERREKRDCLSRPGKKTDPLSQGRAGGFCGLLPFGTPLGAEQFRGINVQNHAKVGKRVQRGHLVPLDVMRHRLLRNSQPFPDLGLRKSALPNGFRNSFLYHG